MPEKTVTLSRSYTVNGKIFDRVTLREPAYNEIYMSGIGEPQEWQPVPGGQALLTYPERIDAYLQRLTLDPGYEYLSPLGAVDSRRLKDALCGFFLESPTPSPSPTSSSSGSDGEPGTSNI